MSPAAAVKKKKKAIGGDRRQDDHHWRRSVTRKVLTLEKNQDAMYGLLVKLDKAVTTIAEDTATQRELTRCARGVARIILWWANKMSNVASRINKIMKPLLVLVGFSFAIIAVGIALLNHGKIPEWALRVLAYLFA